MAWRGVSTELMDVNTYSSMTIGYSVVPLSSYPVRPPYVYTCSFSLRVSFFTFTSTDQ